MVWLSYSLRRCTSGDGNSVLPLYRSVCSVDSDVLSYFTLIYKIHLAELTCYAQSLRMFSAGGSCFLMLCFGGERRMLRSMFQLYEVFNLLCSSGLCFQNLFAMFPLCSGSVWNSFVKWSATLWEMFLVLWECAGRVPREILIYDVQSSGSKDVSC